MAANTPALQEAHNQQLLEREIRSMISTLTGHLTNLSRPATAGAAEDGDDGSGMRMVTLAGTNKGATMEGTDMDDAHSLLYGEDGRLTAFANSNYQAVNNSILLGGSCTAEDPGVHLDITEYVDDDGTDEEKAAKKDAEVAKKGEARREEEVVKKDRPPVENGSKRQGQ